MQINKNEVEGKVVRNPKLARQLLAEKCVIIDIKPDKSDKTKTVFVFKRDSDFDETFDRILKEREEAKTMYTSKDFEDAVEKAVQERVKKEVAERVDVLFAERFKKIEQCAEV